jgi:methionyl-tRNA synthetase
LAIILYPFIPSSAEKIWYQLGYYSELSKQVWYSASEISVEKGHTLNQNIEPIFKRIEKEDIDRQKLTLIES